MGERNGGDLDQGHCGFCSVSLVPSKDGAKGNNRRGSLLPCVVQPGEGGRRGDVAFTSGGKVLAGIQGRHKPSWGRNASESTSEGERTDTQGQGAPVPRVRCVPVAGRCRLIGEAGAGIGVWRGEDALRSGGRKGKKVEAARSGASGRKCQAGKVKCVAGGATERDSASCLE